MCRRLRRQTSARWNFQSGKRIVGTPAAADGIVVFGSADRNIYGLNSKDGKLLWTVKAKDPVLGAVTIENGIAYIGARPLVLNCKRKMNKI